MTNRILAHWTGQLGSFPDEYICYDLETTGLSFDSDLIWQIGHCRISGGEAESFHSTCLNWYAHPAINPRWLDERIEKHAEHMTAAGKPTGCSAARVRSGQNPKEVLGRYAKLFSEVQRAGVVAGHNIARFDNAMFASNMARCFAPGFTFDSRRTLDTAAIVKAAQLNMLPKRDELPGDFCRRILTKTYAPGVYFSLDRHCIPHYKLDELYGVDPTRMHSAGYDAMVTHLLMQELLNEETEWLKSDDCKHDHACGSASIAVNTVR